jgi:tetratricopeptide (TPR) repeat protein
MRLATLRCWALLLDGALGNAVWAAPAAPDCSSATPSEAGNKTERLYQQGECALLRRQYRTATESFSELVARDPNPVWRAELGRAYLGAQQFERAREQFLLALQSDPPQAAKSCCMSFCNSPTSNKPRPGTGLPQLRSACWPTAM